MGRILTVFILIASLLVPPFAWAKEPATPELTLNQAIALALAHSESVKKAEKEIDRTYEWREERADQLDYVPTTPPGNPMVEIAWSNLLAADLTWRMSKKSLTAEQDKVALDACKKYWDVLKAREKVRAAEEGLKKADWELRKARANFQVGMIPQAALVAAEAGLAQARAALEVAKNDLDNAYAAFNRLVGLWPQDRPVLVDGVNFNPLQVSDVETEVGRIVDESPTVWLASEKVTLQKYYEDMMFYTGEYRPYQVRKIEVEQAELDAATARKMMEEITRSLYYSAKSLEESYQALQEGVKTAEENLRVTKVKYDVGMATRAEVAAAEAALAEAKQKALEIACQHAYLKLAFEKPWAYISLAAAGGGAGGSGASGNTRS
ncbi:TolC family protein [Desulfofundulus thermosubterraneus]|uniref:Outer membrane efflux protein n=1 Tax=Desulfofundulus thermosubterraneus DSM 16057 TaxID=1121432 RepID=A0A1M6HZX0_9FIRM|nr:TolC family protein [Desulfofundulus thermosubterraneus]SHJ27768.1 Outer membrane efflux protein [Desulfofundulus thermosubterraneus DSM 16057]